MMKTPAKFVGSTAITFGQFAMITMDYEFLNYKNADLSASDYNFREENSDIEAVYRPVHNLRFGGEVRLGPGYLRGGYAHYASPFATSETNVNSDRNILSAGLGIRNRFFFMDATYSRSMTENSYYLYVPGITEAAVLEENGNRVMLTVGFRF